jgi:hypothetical protein
MSLLLVPSDNEVRATGLEIDAHTLVVRLSVGRVFGLPTRTFPKLAAATPKERATWRFIGQGEGIHWPLLDDDISVERIVRPSAPVYVDLGSPSESDFDLSAFNSYERVA